MLKKIIMACNLLVLVILPSCVKYEEIIPSEVPQGKPFKDSREIAHNYIRSQRLMDQFITRAVFDALWLSNDTRMAYVDAVSRTKTDNERSALLKRQLEENKHWIAFYVLADIRDPIYPSLNDKNTEWKLNLLLADGSRIEPLSIQEYELEPEYIRIFGYRFTTLKICYLVKFPVSDSSGKNLFGPEDQLRLVVSSPGRMGELMWDKHDFKKSDELLADEDYYWI